MQVQSSISRATLSMSGFQMIQWGSIITEIIPVIVTDAEIQVNKIVFMWTMLDKWLSNMVMFKLEISEPVCPF